MARALTPRSADRTVRLIDLLPPCYANSPEMCDWQNALSAVVNELWRARFDLFDQFDLSTATWGLEQWEAAFGLDHSLPPEDYAARRERIQGKMRGAGTSTEEMIRQVASSFTNGEVAIQVYPSEHRFTIQFVSQIGVPPRLDDLKAAIEEAKPAHLKCEYIIQYYTHERLMKTWTEDGVTMGVTYQKLKAHEDWTHKKLKEEELPLYV